MSNQAEHAPVLIFAYGNPSRGDDAVGPAIYELLDKQHEVSEKLKAFDLLIDFQLQIEHAVDLENREAVLFIDASVSCAPPFAFHQLQPERDDSYTTHAMTPASVLAVYQQIHQQPPPPAYLLTIPGYEFGLGQEMTPQAKLNMQQAYNFVKKLLVTDSRQWLENA